MNKLLLILIALNFATGHAKSQSFTIDDLVTLASQPSKNIDHFMTRKGFVLSKHTADKDTIEAGYLPKVKRNKQDIGPKKSIDINLRGDSKKITLQTSSAEYLEGQLKLIKSGYFYDDKKDVHKDSSVLFQKGNISIQAASGMQDSIMQYTFELKAKAIPSSVIYAEELLQFDSHEFLASFFGTQNVKKDMYYFSEKELKKCSVLFSGSPRQAVFVWGDEDNLNNLSYILISTVLPTKGAEKNNPLSGNNEWQFQNGIHDGMGLKDLLKINEMDFDIYGNKSEMAFMVKPAETGKIDFKKTAILFSCGDCFGDKMFNQKVVSALDVAKANLSMHIHDVIIYPSHP